MARSRDGEDIAIEAGDRVGAGAVFEESRECAIAADWAPRD